MLSDKEQAFADAMAGASLVGSFTLKGVDGPPRSERYDLGDVRKVGDGLWVFPTRIRYGENDVTLPITLPVEWAGDTAVIVVDKIGFPGLGVYSARVLIHDGRYAGYWHGGGMGGHLFGEVRSAEPPKAVPSEPLSRPADSVTRRAPPAACTRPPTSGRRRTGTTC